MNSFKIGNQIVTPPLLLAPMAGITHHPFRRLVSTFGGCGLFFSEMISARRLPNETVENAPILKRAQYDKPFFYQIMGNEPEEIGRAIQILQQPNKMNPNHTNGFDINMGCGAPGIRKSGSGSGLMMNLENARRIVSYCRKLTPLPLTVKIRLGNEENLEYLVRFVQSLQEEGIDGVTLHPRLMKERFKRAARWKYVKELKSNVTIPVIGNGDIESISDISNRMEKTGCDGIMIGRLAVQKPWIFRAYADGKEPFIEKVPIYLGFIEELPRTFSAKDALRKIKLFTNYFAENFQFGHHLKMKIKNSHTVEEALTGAHEFFKQGS